MIVFKDRRQAAQQLAEKLKRVNGKNPLILAIPRGAVPMAQVMADALNGEMDVVLVHKLRAPGQPELAIGSVDESGRLYLGRYADDLKISGSWIREEKERQIEMLRQRRARYTPIHPPVSPAHRIVIVVDDGIATGASMIAALRAIRAQNPAKLIAATPVAAQGGLEKIRSLADEVECLLAPGDFYAVGQFFEEFSQVSDEEVIAILQTGRLSPPENQKD